jgi:hypothetical protein
MAVVSHSSHRTFNIESKNLAVNGEVLSVALQAIRLSTSSRISGEFWGGLERKYGFSIWSNLRFQFFNSDIDFDNGVLFLHVLFNSHNLR